MEKLAIKGGYPVRGGKIYYGKRMKSKTKNRKWGYGIVTLPVDHIDNETKVEVDE